jgi:exopolyphosphatase/guanosine-5'-triphosphate,3'-diphosphate pyrophosphatase
VSQDQYKKVQQHVKDTIIHSVQKIRKQKPDVAIGSSGTIMNLAEIAHKTLHQNGNTEESVLIFKDLRKVIDLLCSLPLEERKKIPGINPERADIIISGAAILDLFMKELSLESITITGRGLQDGLLVDYLSRIDAFPLLGVSMRSMPVL